MQRPATKKTIAHKTYYCWQISFSIRHFNVIPIFKIPVKKLLYEPLPFRYILEFTNTFLKQSISNIFKISYISMSYLICTDMSLRPVKFLQHNSYFSSCIVNTRTFSSFHFQLCLRLPLPLLRSHLH